MPPAFKFEVLGSEFRVCDSGFRAVVEWGSGYSAEEYAVFTDVQTKVLAEQRKGGEGWGWGRGRGRGRGTVQVVL